MVNLYMAGKAQPRLPKARRVDAAVRILTDLVAQGKLPLSPDRTKEQRAKAVEKIVDFIERKLN